MAAETPTDAAAVRADFLDALVAGNARLAELVALDAIGNGMRVADLYVDVIGPALADVGHRWEGGKMSIADEHLATGIVSGVMRIVGPTATTRPRRSRERMLLAAVGGEGHVVGLRMIADLAIGAGFDVHELGAAVPVDTLAAVVARHQPVVVGLSVTMAASASQLGDALDEILASGHPPRAILVGGRGVTDELQADDRVRYAPDARAAMQVVEDALRAPA
jgi:methanogenic corrinoid protein MtbC1